MLYLCIPSHNEAPTVGLLLWRIRKVFQEYSREYEVLVYDDASSDATRETLAPYAKLMPLTVLGSSERVGYARAVDALFRAASERTTYPRRDAVVLMQGDFTDRPEALPELVKPFEGGADIVVAERVIGTDAPEPVRKLARLARWIRGFGPVGRGLRVPGVRDPHGSFWLLRVSVVREVLGAAHDHPLTSGPVWAANAGWLGAAARVGRRLETVEIAPQWNLRPRESRVRPWPDAIALFKHGWAVRRVGRGAA